MTVWLCMCKLWSCNRLCVCVPATHTLWIISFFSLFFPRTLWQGPWFSFTNLEMSQWTLKVFLHYARSTKWCGCILYATHLSHRKDSQADNLKKPVTTHRVLINDLLVGFYSTPEHYVLLTELLSQKLLSTEKAPDVPACTVFCIYIWCTAVIHAWGQTTPLLRPLCLSHFFISSIHTLDQLGQGGGGDMRDASAGILFQSFLQEAFVSSSGMSRDVHSLTLSIQHFLCPPQHHSPSKVPLRVVLERLLWRATQPNHASFHLLTVARRGSCGRKLILFHTQSLVLCSK